MSIRVQEEIQTIFWVTKPKKFKNTVNKSVFATELHFHNKPFKLTHCPAFLWAVLILLYIKLNWIYRTIILHPLLLQMFHKIEKLHHKSKTNYNWILTVFYNFVHRLLYTSHLKPPDFHVSSHSWLLSAAFIFVSLITWAGTLPQHFKLTRSSHFYQLHVSVHYEQSFAKKQVKAKTQAAKSFLFFFCLFLSQVYNFVIWVHLFAPAGLEGGLTFQ